MNAVGVDTDPWKVKARSNSEVCKIKDDTVADVTGGHAEFKVDIGPPCERYLHCLHTTISKEVPQGKLTCRGY